MPDPLSPPDRPMLDRRAFAWTFGTAVVLPLTSGVLLLVADSLSSGLGTLALYILAGAVLAWILMFVAGLAARITGYAAIGRGMMLGAFAGALIGGALGAGVLSVVDGYLSR